MPADVAAQVIKRYQAGESAPGLARALRLKECRVYKLLREQGMMRSRSEAVKLEQARRVGREKAPAPGSS